MAAVTYKWPAGLLAAARRRFLAGLPGDARIGDALRSKYLNAVLEQRDIAVVSLCVLKHRAWPPEPAKRGWFIHKVLHELDQFARKVDRRPPERVDKERGG